MKKTNKTALTAAIFSAAISMNIYSANSLNAGLLTANALDIDENSIMEYEPTKEEQAAVYGPAPLLCDFNNDYQIDAFDYQMARSSLASGDFKYFYDLNDDNKFDVADVVLLKKFILGKSDGFNNHEETTTQLVTTLIQPVYGPPVTMTTTFELPQPVYGPPSSTETTTIKPDVDTDK